MKRFYPNGVVDKDDKEHADAVARGFVPEGCRVGGPRLAIFAAQNVDPCSSCPVDRTLCGGRPAQARVTTGDAAWISLQASGAYADLRSLQMKALDALCADEPAG